MKTILIIGAYSAIAEETAKLYASQGDRLVLWARNMDRLKSVEQNLRVLGAEDVFLFDADLDDCTKHGDLLQKTVAKAGKIDVALIAHGVLPDQGAIQNDYPAIEASMRTNFLSYISLLTELAAYFEPLKSGTIAAITSVAADRGRKSNYVYGAAKAGASAFVDGLRGRLAAFGVHVINIKPGLVDTPMTAHLKKGLLFASASKVALGIKKGIEKKRSTIYVPGIWRLIMLVVCAIPEFIFKKTNF
ncbi:MAG: SDR family oxidoreductase [Verrucomicrobiae bacterium]|nr:SDR family oxidoreductase [Verrucomicrobiae bacterium]